MPSIGGCATDWIDKHRRRLFDRLPTAIDGRDPEGVHQARVATRRLRAALDAFAPWLAADAKAKVGKRLRRLSRALGRVRELDVALLQLTQAVIRCEPERRLAIEEVATRLQTRRTKARRRMIRTYAAIDPDRLGQALENLPRLGLDAHAGTLPFGALAAHCAGDLLLTAQRIVETSPPGPLGSAESLEALHATRIGAKKLRYQLEILKPGLGSGAPLALRSLRRLQDHVGALHDDFILAGLLKDAHDAGLESGRARLVGELGRLHGDYVRRLQRDDATCRKDLATLASSGFVDLLKELLDQAKSTATAAGTLPEPGDETPPGSSTPDTTNVLAWETPQLQAHASLLLDSYRRVVGSPLLPPSGSVLKDARALFEAPFVLVSHDTAEPPLLNYGNRKALQLFELDWARLIGRPSQETAEPQLRAEREGLLERVRRDGFVKDYSGVRISGTGRRFRINRATVWTLLDSHGKQVGQAAIFSDLTPLED